MMDSIMRKYVQSNSMLGVEVPNSHWIRVYRLDDNNDNDNHSEYPKRVSENRNSQRADLLHKYGAHLGLFKARGTRRNIM